MLYAMLTAVLFAVLYAESVSIANASVVAPVMGIVGVLFFASLALPRLIFKYTLEDIAPTVLARLMQRAAVGVALIGAAVALTLVVVSRFDDPDFLGEVYVFTLLAFLLFQVVGEVVTDHVLYLQRTHQYNSNQLFAMLLGMAVLLLVLILYLLAFDLAQPPNLHHVRRDILAITLALLGYGRAVYLMAHH